jgi:hypothetical protein
LKTESEENIYIQEGENIEWKLGFTIGKGESCPMRSGQHSTIKDVIVLPLG